MRQDFSSPTMAGSARNHAAQLDAENLRLRIAGLDWVRIERELDDTGYSTTEPILTSAQCLSLTGLYGDEARFRKRVDMARLRFGLGEYKYFAAPLPPIVEELRVASYERLAPLANRWRRALDPAAKPLAGDLAGFLRHCKNRGQTKPTPLMLRYEAGGYNCLHQDRYGEVVFPIQITVALSRRNVDYGGGEFLLLENRPKAQSRCSAVVLEQGQAIIFASSIRPVRGARGYYRVNVRHGISTLHFGLRYSLGIIFHDAT